MRLASAAAVLAAWACTRAPPAEPFRIQIAAAAPLAPLTPTVTDGATVYVQDLVYEPLVRADRDGSLVPALASEFRRLSSRAVLVRIRPNAAFSDDSPVKVEHVVQSINGEGIRVEPEGDWVRIDASRPLTDAELMQMFVYKRSSDGAFLGTGSFALVEEGPTRILLRRRRPAPHRVAEVVLIGYPTARDAFARTLAGEANLLPVPDPKQLEFFNDVQRLKIVRGRALWAVGVAMSLKRLDGETRRSVANTLPAADIAQLVFEGSCPPYPRRASSPATKPLKRQLDITVFAIDSALQRVALAVGRALGAAGGNIETPPFARYGAILKSADFDLLVRYALIWPPSTLGLAWYSRSPFNDLHYSNPRVDAAIEAGDWARAMQELADDPPIDFICTPERLAVVDARVKNPQLGPYGLLETLPDWEVEP